MASFVAVITGASSGIGEATAYRLAEKGMDLVLAARQTDALEGVAATCREMGVDVITASCDVAIEDDVDRVAQAAVDAFGSFDVWINNAGVTLLGSFSEMPPEMFRRVIETNFFGYVYGARAALRQFEARERGTLINVASVAGMVPLPYESAYVASKYAVRGWSASLRQEMDLTGFPDIDICTVIPATIDTPIYRNAANLTGKEVRPIGPVYEASKVADTIANLIDEPLAEVIVGNAGRWMGLWRILLPGAVFERIFGRYVDFVHFRKGEAPITPGNLFNPGDAAGISGEWPRMSPKRKALVGVAAVGALAALAFIIKRKKGSD